MSAILAVIDPKASTVSRWHGRINTHRFDVTDGITAEKVEAIRTQPEQTGEPIVEDPLEAA